ncbi:GNAT family N-acetyltransferase [Marinomonas piezotolerans]|uniref:GNAT family N-acetyltransferase n=1 Tax=Marinomonas piezotolerans TaxID=2213058 RepID=UPI001FE5337A|nr:GNAT family N-acetyltransferase [Marinomonas piezotolerans]
MKGPSPLDLFKVDTLTPYLHDLVELLIDAVDNGAAIGFLPPLSEQEAIDYWHCINDEIQHNSRQIVLVRVDEKVVGAIQLELYAKANALHRAGIEKWMVLSSYQGQGLGRSLLQGVEKVAASLNRQLLTCDTRVGDLAETILTQQGWHQVGEVPKYSRTVMGTFYDCAIYYKPIEPTQDLYV